MTIWLSNCAVIATAHSRVQQGEWKTRGTHENCGKQLQDVSQIHNLAGNEPMREFFRGWKRKLGIVPLVMACVFAPLWARSLSVPNPLLVMGRLLRTSKHVAAPSWTWHSTLKSEHPAGPDVALQLPNVWKLDLRRERVRCDNVRQCGETRAAVRQLNRRWKNPKR